MARGSKINVKGRNDGEQYAKLSYSMLRSPAWRSLRGQAVKVYFELRARYTGSNNGHITLSMDEGARLLKIGKATVLRSLSELEEKGFITRTKRGQWYGRLASEYAVTDKPVNGAIPTHSWKNWRPEKTESRFCNGTIGTPDGSTTEPKDARRFHHRTRQGHFEG